MIIMRSFFYFLIVTVIILYSCKQQENKVIKKDKISIVGKWHKWSTDNGYSEFEIDSQFVVVYNERNGLSKLAYKIENDSFKYLTIQYAAKIIAWGDSMLILRTGDKIATLKRYDESVNKFESAPDESDTVLFNTYKERFYKRADLEWEKAGFDKEKGLEGGTKVQFSN